MLRRLKITALVLALAALFEVSAVAVTPEHLHVKSTPKNCEICFTAHTSVAESPAVLPFVQPQVYGRAAPILTFFGYEPHTVPPSSSRGPPASGFFV